MAIAITTIQGAQQFRGAFSEMWLVSATGADMPDAATGSGTFSSLDVAVPGVALGDVFLGISLSIDTVDTVLTGAVTAANVVTLTLLNNTAGAVNHAASTVKFIVGRPAW